MIASHILEGKYVNLRPVEEEDSEFILTIRNDYSISKYLPKLNVTVDEQKSWISKQRVDKESYYFLIESAEGKRLGTISYYDIVGNHGESGRVCSIGNATQNVEALILFYNYLFYELNVEYVTIWVYEDNKPVLSLKQSIGFTWNGNGIDDSGMKYRKGIINVAQYEKKIPLIKKMLKLG